MRTRLIVGLAVVTVVGCGSTEPDDGDRIGHDSQPIAISGAGGDGGAPAVTSATGGGGAGGDPAMVDETIAGGWGGAGGDPALVGVTTAGGYGGYGGYGGSGGDGGYGGMTAGDPGTSDVCPPDDTWSPDCYVDYINAYADSIVYDFSPDDAGPSLSEIQAEIGASLANYTHLDPMLGIAPANELLIHEAGQSGNRFYHFCKFVIDGTSHKVDAGGALTYCDVYSEMPTKLGDLADGGNTSTKLQCSAHNSDPSIVCEVQLQLNGLKTPTTSFSGSYSTNTSSGGLNMNACQAYMKRATHYCKTLPKAGP